MKELTFGEVFNNIKRKEVWENDKVKIFLDAATDEIAIKDKRTKNIIKINKEDKFKLKRKRVSFIEAFNAYEKGKGIESCITGIRYCKHNFIDYYKPVNSEDWIAWEQGSNFELREIRGEWYIDNHTKYI